MSIEPACRGGRLRRRVLLISYHFPPVGGAGVQRAAKLVKYLGRYAWDATVLAAKNPSVPVLDRSLLTDVPSDALIARARTWEPPYAVKRGLAAPPRDPGAAARRRARAHGAMRALAGLALQPDPQILWAPSALGAGARLLELLPHDAILATAPAYTNLLLGAWLAGIYDLPLLLDFRDEWDLSARYLENHPNGRISRWVQGGMQRWALRRADAIVATTEASAREIEARARAAGSRAAAACIYNGFDPADLDPLPAPAQAKARSEGTFRLVYAGTLWNLTSVRPLVEAIELLSARSPGALSSLDLVLVGRKTPDQQALVNRLATAPCRVHAEDYCDHVQALAWMASADALCLLLCSSEGAERVVPAKLFEYMGMRKEILAILPDGEAAELARWYGAAAHFLPRDTAGIAAWLAARIAGGGAGVRSPSPVERFSREALCGQFASILDRIVMERAAARAVPEGGPDLEALR